ncbi:MAG: flagellar protein FlaG [Steroidobacteraceae bacterium]
MSNEVLSRVAPDTGAAPRRAQPAAMAAGAVDGNALPLNNGKGRPRAESARIELPEPPDLSRMVEKLNEFLRQSARHLQFRYDDSSGRTVITVVDAANGDVIRQIPSDELLALAERMRAAGQPGALIDLRV